MAREIYDTETLLRVMYDPKTEAPTNFWLRNFFPQMVEFATQDIVFEKILGRRRAAPFVLPTVPGKPMFSREGSKVETFRPAYIKPKDSVVPADHLQRSVGELGRPIPLTPEARYDAEVGRIVRFHRSGIERTWEWMAARAVLDGSVTVTYSQSEAVTVDFNRASNHTVVKTSGYWDSTFDVLADLQAWIDRIAQAEFGGIVNKVILGSAVLSAIRNNTKLKDQMDLQYRGNAVDVKSGLLLQTDRNENVRYWGTLGEGVEVWVYDEYYENAVGTAVKFMDPKDVLLVAGDIEGVRAFGAILDEDASLQPMSIFPKMWSEKDPSGRYIMSQSAPLMVPVNPNRTLRARVLA